MKVKVLGCSGGQTPNVYTSCYQIDKNFFIDAGAICLNLTLEQQRAIDFILITHTHIDHIKDLAFLADNIVGARSKPLKIFGSPTTIKGIKDHLFNDVLWPDFSKIPDEKNPILEFHEVPMTGEAFVIGGYKVQAVPVNHIPGATGYIISKGESSILFTGDTSETEKIWELAQKTEFLKAIFTEISFPSSFSELAKISKHYCPETLEKELEKMGEDRVPVYIAHFKPAVAEDLRKEIKERKLSAKKVHILKQGLEFKF